MKVLSILIGLILPSRAIATTHRTSVADHFSIVE